MKTTIAAACTISQAVFHDRSIPLLAAPYVKNSAATTNVITAQVMS
jgi:hypothetical protein